jgi:hypothetical protein
MTLICGVRGEGGSEADQGRGLLTVPVGGDGRIVVSRYTGRIVRLRVGRGLFPRLRPLEWFPVVVGVVMLCIEPVSVEHHHEDRDIVNLET